MVARELRECCALLSAALGALTCRGRVSLKFAWLFFGFGKTRRGRGWAWLVTARITLRSRVFIRFGRIVDLLTCESDSSLNLLPASVLALATGALSCLSNYRKSVLRPSGMGNSLRQARHSSRSFFSSSSSYLSDSPSIIKVGLGLLFLRRMISRQVVTSAR